jgi:hypothetical protein
METLRAYKNCTYTKAQAVKDAKEHRDKDHLLSGTYYSNGRPDWKGCSVGCFTKDPDGGHDKYPALFGLPEWVARLQDSIFEGLAQKDRAWWHVALFTTIKPGQDMEKVFPRFMRFILTENLVFDREKYPQVQEVITRVVGLYEREISGDIPVESDWSAARSAAESAARSAARSAAWSAAESAARSAAESAAESAAWKKIAEGFLQIVKDCQ